MRFLTTFAIVFALGILLVSCGIHSWMWQYWAFMGLIVALVVNTARYR